MGGLFDQVIAAQPKENAPVADLVLQFAHPLRPQHTGPAAALHVVVGADEPDVADGPVADLLDAVQVVPLMAALQADHDREFFLLRHFVCRHQHPISRRVDAARLFQERVLAGFDGRCVVDRPEVRRRGQQHQVDAGVDHLLVGVEADEPTLGRDVDLGRQVRVLRQVLQAELDAFREQIADRHEFHRSRGQQRFAASARAAIAAADQADADHVAAGGMRGAGDAQARGQRSGDGGRLPTEGRTAA